MRLFLASRGALGSALRPLPGLALAALLIGPAQAQDSPQAPAASESQQVSPAGQPLRLAPPTTLVPQEGQGSAAAQPGAAQPGAGQPGAGQADSNATQDLEGIEVSRLTELDPESVGILDPEHGGFPGDLWRGTDRRTVERLLPRLSGALGSATLRDLARRLLLSNAAPPATRPGASAKRGTNLLALRVGRLAAMGDFDGLSGLLEATPQRYDNEAVARARVETLFLDGHGDTACKEVRFRVAEHEDTTYWRKALVYCQILQKDLDGANLGLALLREQGAVEEDPVFFALADSLTGLRDLDPNLSPATALHLAMFQSTGRPLPVEAIDQASPGLLVLLVRASGNSLEERTKAAERAVRLGLVKPDDLAGLYLAHQFDASQRANAISSAEHLSGPERRALFYQAARAQDVPAARAELLNAALSDARKDGSYGVMAQVLEPMVAEIPLQAELAWFAESAGRVLYAAGRFEQASAWVTLARQESLLDSQAATAVESLWPYSRLAGAPAAAWQGDLATWAETQSGLTPEQVGARELLLRTVFEGLGESDPLLWSDLVGAEAKDQRSTVQPDAALVYALSEASQSGRLGETVLLSLLALGEPGPAGANPLVLRAVLSALMRVNLTHEARLLAIEAAVADGI